MKRLERFTRDRQIAIQELGAFGSLLHSKAELSEKEDLLPFFRDHKQLVALLGCLHQVVIVNRIGWEYDLFGDFKVDFVAGDTKKHSYCFTELQDARHNSIFQSATRANSIWAHSFEEAFGQIIDWSYKLADTTKSDEFDNRFGSRIVNPSFVIIVGRSKFLDRSELKRFDWRRSHIALDSKPVKCLTYDELLEEFDNIINVLTPAAEIDTP